MKEFIDYIDKIKAEEEVKEKTKLYIENALSNNTTKTGFKFKRFITAAAVFVLFVMLSIGGYVYYDTPINYICMDINPSVELGVNRFGMVVDAEGINEDGRKLLATENLLNTKYQNALGSLIILASQNGYISQNGSTVIAITSLSDNEKSAVLLKDEAKKKVEEAIQKRNMKAIIYDDWGGLKLREQAKAMNTSPGKYRLISMIKEMDSSFDAEKYKNAKIYELIAKANELITAKGTTGIQLKEYERTVTMVIQTAKEMQDLINLETKKQNTNIIQEKTQNQGTESEMRNTNQIRESSGSTGSSDTGSGSTGGGSTNGGSKDSGSTSSGNTGGGSISSGSTNGGSTGSGNTSSGSTTSKGRSGGN